jgi:exonuclease VII large subunit
MDLKNYHRQYYQAHKSELDEKARQYRQAHKSEKSEKARQYRQAHKSELDEKARQYYQAHKSELDEKARQYYQARVVRGSQLLADFLDHRKPCEPVPAPAPKIKNDGPICPNWGKPFIRRYAWQMYCAKPKCHRREEREGRRRDKLSVSTATGG